MSDVRRFWADLCVDHVEAVLYSDYAALEAENAKLRQQAREVVMPERQEHETYYDHDEYRKDGWNSCLDEFARLNKGAGSHE